MKRFIAFLMSVMVMSDGVAQNRKDTTAMIMELNKVMSFGVSAYLYYTTLTRMDATPVMQETDTGSIKGVFYKNASNIYYHNGQEEIFLEDSFLVMVNDSRRSIIISKVDAESRARINVTPLDNKKLQEMFRKSYTINRSMVNSKTARMNFESKQKWQGASEVDTRIALEYGLDSWMPTQMEMEMKMKEPANDEIVATLKEEGIDPSAMLQTIDEVRYIVRSQRVRISFEGIDTSREKATQMPSWKSRVEYNQGKDEYEGRGHYSAYEVTKTF
jgi:hypothetical protein